MLSVNGLYGHVARNNLRSVWMFLGFVIAYQIVGAVLLVLPLLVLDPSNLIIFNPSGYFKEYGWIVLLLSAAAFAFRYQRHMKSLQDELGFGYVTVMQNPRLVQIVDNLARTAGIAMPKVAILPVNAMNAFACGVNKDSATVVVTEGLLRALNDDELEAVVAHEITHILNGDIRSMAFANVSISSLMKLARFNPFKVEGWGKAILVVIFPPLMLLAMASGFMMSLAMTVGKVTRLLIASSREYIADAEAVRLTHKPAALISALRKIEGRSEVPGLDPIADAMMIDGATIGEFATHPTISERIKVLQRHAGSMAHDMSAFDTNAVNGETFKPAAGHDTTILAGAFGALGGLFAKKQASEAEAKQAATPKNLIDRVNHGSDRNAFGVSESVKRKIKIVALLFFAFMFYSTWQMQQSFKRIQQTVSTDIERSVKPSANKKVENRFQDLAAPLAQNRKAGDARNTSADQGNNDSVKPTKAGLVIVNGKVVKGQLPPELSGKVQQVANPVSPSSGDSVQEEAASWKLR